MNSSSNNIPEIFAGLSVGTLLNLKHSDDEYISYTCAGPNKEVKYSGWIVEPNGRPIINTEQKFDSSEEAINHMKEVVKTARGFDLKLLNVT